jgi:putative ABC transport system permease protein
MDLGESLKMAVKTLTANKLRSSLTMLGIIIGNASVIAMVGLGEGAQRFITDQLQAWDRMCSSLCQAVVKRVSWAG